MANLAGFTMARSLPDSVHLEYNGRVVQVQPTWEALLVKTPFL